MTLMEISNARLISQNIVKPELKKPSDVIRWMGAIQAQDYSMAKWAVGVRLKDPSDESVESAINKGEIIRIHVLRPTWHFIGAEDIHWMLQLSAPKIKSSLRTRHNQLELSELIIKKTQAIIEKKLSKEISLTREELADEFHKAKIRTDANRLSHILFRAELDGIVCSGPKKEKKLTYSLLHERVPVKKVLSRDEALAELAKRYFLSRCPATLADFIWWSNLSVSDARKAIDSVKSGFISETIGSGKYWFPDTYKDSMLVNTQVHLLPAYDEFLISYRDRSSALSAIYNKKTVSNNGIFFPAIVVKGQVAGLWKRTSQKNKVTIETDFFQLPDESVSNLTEKKANLFGKFLNKETDFKNKFAKPR